MNKIKLKIKRSLIFLILPFLIFGFISPAFAQDISDFKTEGKALLTRVAPGEKLPISVKLMNFGEGGRVDVTINYVIENSLGKKVSQESETVAVETTSTYIREVPIPEHFSPGQYTAVTEIEYDGQKVPAISEFQFTVENKVFGIFLSRFILYTIVGIFLAVILIFIGRFINKKRRSRFEVHDYSDTKKEERVFYEMISDIIMQMRYQYGKRAIELAQKIEGLIVEDESGKVLDINKDPAEIVSLLMIYYKKEFGKNANFISKRIDKKGASKDSEVNKNINMIKKYFSE